jgi:hypothetical protein
MKNIFFVLFLMLSSCITPYKVVETISKDSTGKEIKTVQKFYDNRVVTTQASLNLFSTPFWYGHSNYYSMPYYNPIIIPINPRATQRVLPRGRKH